MQATFTVHIQPLLMGGSDSVAGVTMGVTRGFLFGCIVCSRHSSRAIR